MEMKSIPNKYFFVKGASEGATKLNAFDRALIAAGIGDTNLIKLSSIIPPNCRESPNLPLPAGSFVPTAYASLTSAKPGEIISAAVAVGIPADNKQPGLIMEYSASADTETVDEMVKKMVMEGFKYRKRALKEVKTAIASIEVEQFAAAFAGVVLWY